MLSEQPECGARCPVCDRNDFLNLFDVPSPYVPGLSYRIHACQSCKHRYAVGPMDAQLLADVYGVAFHKTSQQHAGGRRSAIATNAAWRARWLRSVCGGGKLLDVGAGRGYFVREASAYFQAEGIDYSSSAESYGEELGVKMKSGDFLVASYPLGSFDVVTMWDVLASMSNVSEAVAKAAEVLTPGGHFVVTIPMGDSTACKLARRRWPLWIPPVNLHYFSQQSIVDLMAQHGFEVILSRPYGKRVAFNFLLLKLARSMGFNRLGLRLAATSWDWSVRVNLGDILTVVGKKVKS